MPERKPRPARPARRTAYSAAAPPWPATLRVHAKFWLTLGPKMLFGDGKARLLERVDSLGSLRKAAQSMGMSYRLAWGRVRAIDRAAGFRFLEHSGRGARTHLRLSARGRRFLEAYRTFREPLPGLVQRRFDRVFKRGD